MPIVFPKAKKLVSEKKCANCGKALPENSRSNACPFCGGPLVVVTKVKYERYAVAPHELSLDKSDAPKLRQSDLVKDFGFPDVNEEIRKAKEKGK